MHTVAFMGCPIETLTIPASFEKLGEYSFVRCKSLKSVKFLGDAPKQLGKSVFDKTNDDFVIYYDKDASGWDNTSLSEYKMEAY